MVPKLVYGWKVILQCFPRSIKITKLYSIINAVVMVFQRKETVIHWIGKVNSVWWMFKRKKSSKTYPKTIRIPSMTQKVKSLIKTGNPSIQLFF